MDFEKYIKMLNIIFTDSFKRKDLVGVNLDDRKVNYDESINLFTLISSFNELYKSFRKEYEELEKLSLGKDMEILKYSKFSFNKDKYRMLIMHIDEPFITPHPETILYLREINGEIMPFVTNNISSLDKNYYKDDVKLNKAIVKKYLDLFEKYNQLLKMYNYFKNQFVFGDGHSLMLTKINENILNELHEFIIYLGTVDIITELVINLGNNFGISYDKCRFKVYDKEQNIQNADYNNLFQNIYINQKYTSEEAKEKARKRIK